MKKKRILIPLFSGVILMALLPVFANTFVKNVIGGRIHFPDKYIGAVLAMDDGKKFTVLRRLQVERDKMSTGQLAVFKVRFKFNSLSIGINKQLSMIPAPFLMGMEGFLEKYWTFEEETGYFQGIYQWESKESAENYLDSFIYNVMVKRSAEGTLQYEIIPDIILSEYIDAMVQYKPVQFNDNQRIQLAKIRNCMGL